MNNGSSETIVLTDTLIEAGRTPRGGFNAKQLAVFGVHGFTTGWKRKLVGRLVQKADYSKFVGLATAGKAKLSKDGKRKGKGYLNALSDNCAYFDRLRGVKVKQPKPKRTKHGNRGHVSTGRRDHGPAGGKAFIRPDYVAYMNSGEWARKRAQAFAFHGRKCSVCGSTSDLHVHHKTYARLGREKMKDLTPLCSGCHANRHEGKRGGPIDPMTEQFLAIARG
jgi:hypothetical protein